MLLSSKNQLQQHYQKLKSSKLPTYENRQLSSFSADAGSCMWQSVVTLPDTETRYTGIGWSKREADQAAAREALKMLEKKKKLGTGPGPAGELGSEGVSGEATVQKDVLILIDLENSPNYTVQNWSHIWWAGCQIEAFVGKLSSHANKDLKSIYPFVHQFHIVDSGHKDAVDHAISVRAGQWLSSDPKFMFLVSRDRFALALLDVIRQQHPIPSRVEHYTHMDQCFKNIYHLRHTKETIE